MADSDITVSNLATAPGIGVNRLSWTVNDPHAKGVAYLRLDVVEVFRASSNNRALASKVAEGKTNAIDVGLAGGQTYFYWVRARNQSGLYGDWSPSSATGGVSGTVANDIIIGGTLQGGTINGTTINGGTMNGTTVHGGTFDATLCTVTAASGLNALTLNHSGGGDGIRINGGGGGATIRASDANIVLTNTGGATPIAITHSAGGNGIVVDHTGGGLYGIYSNKTNAATWSFYADGAAGNYGPFTGAHEALMRKGVRIESGDVVCDDVIVAKPNLSNTLFQVVPSEVPRSRRALGVFVGRRRIRHREAFAGLDRLTKQILTQYDRVVINSVGEGQINVCGENGPIEPGSLLVTSSIPGKAMRQDDDLIRACTVARAREGAEVSTADHHAQIACIYLCG